MCVFIKTRSINGSTNIDLDTRTKSLGIGNTNNTRVGDLTLDKSGLIKSMLGTNFKSNRAVCLGIPRSLTRNFNVTLDLVVVRSSKVAQVVGSMNSNSILGSRIADSSIVTADLLYECTISYCFKPNYTSNNRYTLPFKTS